MSERVVSASRCRAETRPAYSRADRGVLAVAAVSTDTPAAGSELGVLVSDLSVGGVTLGVGSAVGSATSRGTGARWRSERKRVVAASLRTSRGYRDLVLKPSANHVAGAYSRLVVHPCAKVMVQAGRRDVGGQGPRAGRPS